MARIGVLEEMTIDEVRALAPNTAVIPVGSTEPHGPALPYATDSIRVEGVVYPATALANTQGGRVIALPTQRISLNNNFRRFPFACRMQVTTFIQLLTDYIAFLADDGIERIVIVNGHGGNPEVIQATLRHLAAADGPFCCLVSPSQFATAAAKAVVEKPSNHAGEGETVEVMHHRPDLVRVDRLGEFPVVEPELDALVGQGVYFVKRWDCHMPASCGGDATLATPEKGRVLVESAIAGMAEFLAALSLAPASDRFPYA